MADHARGANGGTGCVAGDYPPAITGSPALAANVEVKRPVYLSLRAIVLFAIVTDGGRTRQAAATGEGQVVSGCGTAVTAATTDRLCEDAVRGRAAGADGAAGLIGHRDPVAAGSNTTRATNGDIGLEIYRALSRGRPFAGIDYQIATVAAYTTVTADALGLDSGRATATGRQCGAIAHRHLTWHRAVAP